MAMTREKWLLILEFFLFNSAWFLLVFIHSGKIWLAGLAIFILQIVIKHLVKQMSMTTFVKIIHVASIGIIVDSLLTYFGVFLFPSPYHAPLWLMMLWLNFAFALNFSMAWLGGYRVLGTLATAGFAVVSYFSGYKLGAVDFGHSLTFSLALIFVIWLVMTPILIAICHGGFTKGEAVTSQ